MIFVELTSSIRFAVVTSSLNGERVELSLANKIFLFLVNLIRSLKHFEHRKCLII